MDRAKPRAASASIVAAVLCGCSSVQPSTHVLAAAETVTVTDGALLPSAELHIPQYASVVFRNERGAGDIEVALDRELGQSQGCATTLHFEAVGHGAVARALPPHGIATICFHEAGTFPFVVRTAAGELHGSIVVGSAR
jgi:hypothetical protein